MVFILSLYYASLSMFAFVSHPVSYCFLLLLCVFRVSGVLYLFLGFSWYVILLSLVYVGGVYVLFVFVSVLVPNTSPQVGSRLALFAAFFFFFLAFLSGLGFCGLVSFEEGSHYVCSFYEGLSYCFFCLVLLVGFSILSVVVSEKGSFFR